MLGKKYLFPVFTLVGIATVTFLIPGPATTYDLAAIEYEYAGEWAEAGSGEGQFNLPEGLAVAPDGTVYVADTGNDRVQYFSADGSFLGLWDGTPPGRFLRPKDIRVNSSGIVYVTDYCGHRVQYFSPTGEYFGEWGKRGSGAGEFNDPEGLAIASDGRVYVADAGNRRIQYFTAQGGYLGEWRPKGVDRTWGRRLSDIAVGPDGRFYAAIESRIKYFSAAGDELGEWGSEGVGDGQFRYKSGPLAVTQDGTVYVADTGNSRIQYFDANGSFLGSWETVLSRPRRYDSDVPRPTDVAVAPDGSVVVIGNMPLEVQFYSRSGEFLRGWPARIPGQASDAYRVAVGPNGYVYVVDTFSDTVHYYDGGGEYLGNWGSRGGMFVHPSEIAVGAEGNIYLVFPRSVGIMYFSPTGSYIGGWGPDEYFYGWGGLSISPGGNVLVGDGDSNNWKYFTRSGSLLATREFSAEIDGVLHSCRGRTAVGPDGTIYVLESHEKRVCYFNAEGDFLGVWELRGTGAGEFEFPEAIAVGSDGTVYILYEIREGGAFRVQFFTRSGDYRGEIIYERRTRWRSIPFGSLAVARDRSLYVLDAAENKVFYFRPVRMEE